ncbi:hypothetical protein Dtox_3704 [Desulfofarcimen acetoxidans DSM 771]|uniref:Uncharacterized protein n=1 Tax=Desulfofarcimen acetoxidans (strain ATCC 49208 / DSM 771 / KCTC 5769 / VKM B-1644 / 5575) TaxID=485916 RepID=C8VWP8_DESAS|nr:hypothetical protein [Desulfofarcimen acetoxidans]ACV64412.1 hypothetical protein Dtox_3704 [Desulfofarcimen acetoxidans DSM 771]
MQKVNCPICSELTVKTEFDFWRCPSCRCEIWPADDMPEKKKPVITDEEIKEVYKESLRQGIRNGSGSGNRRNRNKKHPTSRYINPFA